MSCTLFTLLFHLSNRALGQMDGMGRPCHLQDGENSCAQVEVGEFEPASRALLLLNLFRFFTNIS